MTTENEKLAQKLEQFAALLRGGEWDIESWVWRPDIEPTMITLTYVDGRPVTKANHELIRLEFSFVLNKKHKGSK